MYCLRCGRETVEERSFCLDCRKEMAKYPVDPNAVVQLPVRKQQSPKKLIKRRLPPEEQVKALKRLVRMYACLFFAALIALVLLCIPLIRNNDRSRSQIGQNYTTVKPNTAQTETAALPE